MWAALKSPLLIGADLRKLTPATLTILNNPAVIAISQDPLGQSVNRIRRDTEGLKKDKYGIGETQVWSGHLSGGDQVVILLNAADENVEMTASLEEIFYSDGPEGSAEAVHQAWYVYDLWANRMDSVSAQKILDADENMEAFESWLKEVNWYNATELSYKDGLKVEDRRLLGKLVQMIQAEGVLRVSVKRHSVEMFRLRSAGAEFKSHSSAKDEL
jgi:alpha-galactosidase